MQFLEQYTTNFEREQLLKHEKSYVGLKNYIEFLENLLRKAWKDGLDSGKRELWHKKLPYESKEVLIYTEDGSYVPGEYKLGRGFIPDVKVKYWKEITPPDESIMENKYNDI